MRWPLFLGYGVPAMLLPCVFVSLVPFVLFLSLGLSLAVWPIVRSRIRSLLPLSFASLLLAVGVAAYSMRQYDRTLNEVRDQYPLVSMVDRVPEPTPSGLDEASLKTQLATLEDVIESERRIGRWRTSMLERLHDKTVHRFATAPGFGVGRLMGGPELLRSEERNLRPPIQDVPVPSAEGMAQVSAKREEEFRQLHLTRIGEFTNGRRFGLVRNRREVSGFFSHGFDELRTDESPWKVHRIDLISLLLHNSPVVYVSDKFPEMEKLRKAPTRELDAFERSSLEKIQDGSELEAGETEKYIRMVGAIRNAKQCVECHGGKRGDLLGAFSYVLQRKVSGGP